MSMAVPAILSQPMSIMITATITWSILGSLYTDIVIRASGMNGECLRGASVLVVKTHHRLPQEWTTEKISAMGRNVS